MRYDVGRFRRPMRRGAMEQMVSLISLGDGSTLSLDFTAMSGLDSRFTFTRSSATSTYINSSGLVTTAGTNVPRFDYDPTTLAPRGLLIEGSATNLLTYSEDFNAAAWTDTSITRATGNADPAGGTTAVRFTASAGNATVIRAAAIGTTATRTFSIFLRRVTGTGNIDYTLDNGSTYTTQAITASWVRYTFAATSANHQVGIRIVTSGDAIEMWGAQLEAGSGASSYIPTGASTVQRAADACEITGTNFSSWWPANQSEFTMLWTGDITRSPATNQFLWLNRNSGGTSRSRGYVTTGSVIRANAVALYDFTASPATNATVNTVFKHALAVKTGDSAMYVNTGTTIGSETTTNALTSGFDADKIIFNPNSDNFMHMRTLKFWPQRLPNATLNGLVT